MDGQIDITWEVEDGYVGKSRPQTTTVYVENYEGMDLDEIKDALWTDVQEDFYATISWYARDMDDVAKQIFAIVSKKAD